MDNEDHDHEMIRFIYVYPSLPVLGCNRLRPSQKVKICARQEDSRKKCGSVTISYCHITFRTCKKVKLALNALHSYQPLTALEILMS